MAEIFAEICLGAYIFQHLCSEVFSRYKFGRKVQLHFAGSEAGFTHDFTRGYVFRG